MFRFNGVVWTRQSSPTDGALRGIWAAGDSSAVAVGDAGTILHYDGTWTSGESPFTSALHAVWGSAPDDIVAVGDNGTIVH